MKKKEEMMRKHKSIQADAAGHIDLGKKCANRLFTISEESEKITLEPARIVPEQKLRSHEALILHETEWSRFQEIMDSDDEPTDNLRRLMEDSKS